MPRFIFTSRYLSDAPVAQLENLVGYMGTRPGVEFNRPENTELPATRKQQDLIARLQRQLPASADLPEYADYMASPNRGNASAYISTVMEHYADQIVGREQFVRYMGMRPGAERVGAHGLFSQEDNDRTLNDYVTELSNHEGNVWTHVLSLRREDAARLGYDNQAAYKTLLRDNLSLIAQAHKIPLAHLRWMAAYHDEGDHPHAHLLVYYTDPADGYLNNVGIQKMRSAFAGRIFHEELQVIYAQQTQTRDVLRRTAADLVRQIPPQLEQRLWDLHDRLSGLTGRKVYAYLSRDVKATVDTVVAEMARIPEIARLYDAWCGLERDKLHTYTGKEIPIMPLEQQKVFRPIHNAVIRAALELEHPLTEAEFGQADAAMDIEADIEAAVHEAVPPSLPSSSGATEFWKHPGFKFYKEGRDKLPWDTETALALLRESAALGFVPAEYLLGKTYLQGKYVLQNIPEAVRRLTSAAEKETQYAACKLGRLYLDGRFIMPDLRQAEHWLAVAARLGSPYGQYSLGKLYLDGPLYRPDAALALFHQAAEQDNTHAQLKLGRLYLAGAIVPQNVPLAMSYLQQAANKDNQFAEYALGKLFLYGKEVSRDKEQAAFWLTRAAQHGHPYAAELLTRWRDAPVPSVFGTAAGLVQQLLRMLQPKTPAAGSMSMIRPESKLLAEIAQKKAALGNRDGQKRQIRV